VRYEVTDSRSSSVTMVGVSVVSTTKMIWLDADDVVRRVEATTEVRPAQTEGSTTDATMDFFDFGASADIAPPRPSEVQDHESPPPPTTTPPPLAGNQKVTFQPVLATSAPPCHTPAVADKHASACYSLGSVEWAQPVVQSASAHVLSNGQWVIELHLTDGGIAQFNRVAAQCYDREPTCPTRKLAVLVDDTVQSAPDIQSSSFKADQIQISGNFTEQEARALAAAIG
jgi:hypothetical protein